MILTIVTVNSNNRSGLISTLDSLINQVDVNFDNVEWILIDALSNDNSLDVIGKYTLPFSYKVISEADSGIYDGMNKGVLFSTGEYIQFLNSGDILENNKSLSDIFNSISNSSFDCFLFGFAYLNKFRLPRPLYWRFWSLPTSHQSIIYKRIVFKDNLYSLEYRLASDYHHFMGLCRNNISFHFINVILIRNEKYGSDSNMELLQNEYRIILSEFLNPLLAYSINYVKFLYIRFLQA